MVAIIDQTGAVTPVLNGITGSPYRIGEIAAKNLHYEDTSGFGEVINADGDLDEPLAFHQMLDSAVRGILVAGVRAYDVTHRPLPQRRSHEARRSAERARCGRFLPLCPG